MNHRELSDSQILKTRLKARGYPKNLIDGTLSEVKLSARQLAVRKQTKKTHEGTMPFVTTYHPAVKNLKQLLMQESSLIHNQPMLKNIYKTPPIISYRRGKSLKTYLLEQNFEGTYDSVATAKTRGEVRAGMS